MDVKLHLIRGNPKGKTLDVPAGTFNVGRAEDSDLIIASTRVSRHHCEIVNDQGRAVIRDKSSANGTFVNRQKIKDRVLQPGDEVQVGPLTFVVEINGARKRPASTPAQVAAKPVARPSAKPAASKLQSPKRSQSPRDIAATLERLADGKPPVPPPKLKGKKTDNDVLQISDDDLLQSEE